ncbi:coiled-coil domain-containing protein [Natronorubrum aibiense]|uniref:Ribbon-helix-helix protein, CopG family n=1 Tax=Natronorubrum aibiense TaxID=348826 RepID=A0A5P9P609_9EURY|nr:hypothetical protein [Natronorubrum aibiense]QFU83377.1 hypothetical protein GCU68_12925 [Natronorubrum aibiense]
MSISLRPETLEALTSEAEIQDFDSRSEYIRHILQSRHQIESIDQTKVQVVEEVAEQLKESHHGKISEIEDRLSEYELQLNDIHNISKKAREHHEFIEQTEDKISELASQVASNEEKLEEHRRRSHERDRERRNNEEEIRQLKRRIEGLQSELRDLRED